MIFMVMGQQFPNRPGFSSDPKAIKHVVKAVFMGVESSREIWTLEINTMEEFTQLTDQYGAHYIQRIHHPFPELPSVIWEVVPVG